MKCNVNNEFYFFHDFFNEQKYCFNDEKNKNFELTEIISYEKKKKKKKINPNCNRCSSKELLKNIKIFLQKIH